LSGSAGRLCGLVGRADDLDDGGGVREAERDAHPGAQGHAVAREEDRLVGLDGGALAENHHRVQRRKAPHDPRGDAGAAVDP